MPKKELDPNISEGVLGKFYGGLRDVIEVEVNSIDDQPYTTNMRSSDAIRDIFIGSLGLDKNQIIGIQVAWKGKPVISFRLKTKINIDQLPQTFSYEKKRILEDGTTTTNIINCTVKGVRPPNRGYIDDGTRTVTFEKCGWKITHEQIIKWASYYGRVLSKVTEHTDDDLDPDVQPDGNQVGCGNLQVLVKINKAIPQFLPMQGYKVRIYYKDIPKICTNCYKTGHVRKECKNPNRSWLHYVVEFISENEQIQEEDFGYWMKKSQEFVRDHPETFSCPDETDLDDLNLSSTDYDSENNDSNVTLQNANQSSPKVITSDPIPSVSSVVDRIENQKSKKEIAKKEIAKTLPTEEKPKRGRPKGTSDKKHQ